MPRLSSRAKRRALAKRLKASTKAERRYEAALGGLLRAVEKETLAFLGTKGVLRGDAVKPLRSALELHFVRMIAAVPRTVAPLFDAMGSEVSGDNAKALGVIGINANAMGISATIAKARDENIRLVEKAVRLYAEDVRDIFDDPEANTWRVEELQARLLERGNVSVSRAELIARDQTLKTNAAITQTRQVQAGVESYEWSTSLDERVRDEHRALEGQRFAWNNPPAVGHPGEDFQCRCVAIPVISEVYD
jgi:SPP1 gp7 family putative phage head morphogenesis protein